jgi:hypothetical protein
MKSDQFEHKDIIKKLLEKTRQGRVEWVADLGGSRSFRCVIGSPEGPRTIVQRQIARPDEEQKNFSFTVMTARAEDSSPILTMWDHSNNEIFRVVSNDLPTSPEEEEISEMIDEIYELARRQALKIEQKLEWASTLLDRV